MLSPCACFSPTGHRIPATKFQLPNLHSPSVTSVTSVRCSPPCAGFSPTGHRVPATKFSAPQPPFPLRDLRDLRAMLSPSPVSRPPATASPRPSFSLNLHSLSKPETVNRRLRINLTGP